MNETTATTAPGTRKHATVDVPCTVPAGRLLRRPQHMNTPKQARARAKLLKAIIRRARAQGATWVQVWDRDGLIDAFLVGVHPRIHSTAPLAFDDGKCAEIALYMLGASREEARGALAAYGYTGNGMRLDDTIIAAEDLFGPRAKLLGPIGIKALGATTAREFADAVARQGAWLVFAGPHVMATAGGRLWNACGWGNEPVNVAVMWRTA